MQKREIILNQGKNTTHKNIPLNRANKKKQPLHPKIQILRTVKFSVEQISWTVFITISHAFKHYLFTLVTL